MFRIASFFRSVPVCLLLFSTLLVGCGGQNNSVNDASAEAVPADDAALNAEAPTN
ncbi:MAG: hypothetical protein KDA89_06185 [Planctomycetaceae bacterium]|nr:hypothetical protein [Planctomycetaceae bacterium]